MSENKFYTAKDMEAIKILDGFLPDKIFDAHAHLYDKSFNPGFKAHDDDGSFEVYKKAMFPALCNPKEFHLNMIANPDPIMVDPSSGAIEASDKFVLGELEKDPGSVAEILVTPKDSPEDIEKRLVNPRIRGLKVYRYFAEGYDNIQDTYYAETREFLSEATWEVANKHKLCITLHMVKDKALSDEVNLEYIIDHAKRYPDATLILAHAARSFAAWTAIESIDKVAHLDNVWYDFAAICESPAMFYIMKKAGIEKCMWGSDFPVCTYRGKSISFADGFHWILKRENSENMVNLIPEERYWFYALENLMATRQACKIGEFSESQVEDLFFNNAMRLFGKK